MNFHSDDYQNSLDDLSSCAFPFKSYLPYCLPVNYSNFMNWSSPDKVIIQGITEPQAALVAVEMKNYGTNVVAGVSPGQGGKTIENIPIFDLVEQVLTVTDKIDISIIFISPCQVLDAIKEAISVGIKRIIIITSNVPPLDTIESIKYAQANNTQILGPGSDGIIIPDRVCLGKLQPEFFQLGKVGLITDSRDLCYEVVTELNRANLGQSMAISLGSDRIVGSNLSQWLSILNEDPNTEAIVSIGKDIKDIEEIATFCQDRGDRKPIVSYIAGLKTPQEIMYGDAVTIISNHLSASIPAVNLERRIFNKLKKVGIKIAKRPSEIPLKLSQMLNNKTNKS